MKRILLVGYAGFVGRYVQDLLYRNALNDVTCVDSFEPQVHGTDRRGRRAGEHDYADTFDVVIHLAARVGVGQSMYEPASYVECNTLDTARLLEGLTPRKPKRLVVASSMSIYGEGATETVVVTRFNLKTGLWDPPTKVEPIATPEAMCPDPRSPYALTKLDQERLCLIWGEANGVEVVALRFFNIYGPGQSLTNPYTGVLAIFATRLLNAQAPIIYEDGQQTRDFIHVDDVADAVVHAACTPLAGGVYNVGTGVPRTIESVARDLAQALNADLPPVITGQHRVGDIRHCYADVSKLKATGWAPKVTWEDGLRAYVEWLKTQPTPVDKFDDAAKELQTAGLVR